MDKPQTPRLEKRGIPLYVQLAGILRAQIASGEYKPGDSLPTEERVARDLGVSLITVREARRLLADEGRISRHAGKGTFVAEPPASVTSLAAPTLEDLIYGGQEHETRRECLARAVKVPDPHTAELLEIPPRSKAVEFQIRLYANALPLGHITSTVPYHLGRPVTAARLEEKPLVLLLAELCQVRITEVDQWTNASEADRQMAETLDLQPGAPVLIIRRVFFEANGRPAQVSINTFRGDRFRHHVRVNWATLDASPQQRHAAASSRETVTRSVPHDVQGGHKR
jgi:GntR family transcriptional regulator